MSVSLQSSVRCVSAACHVVEQRAQCGHSASNSGCTAAADEHCSVRGHEPTRTALCLFGMARNIDATRSYLEQNLIGPLSSACALDIFIHNLLHEDVRANFSIGVRACREEQEVQRHVDARLILQDRVARTMQRSIGRLHHTHTVPVMMNLYRSRYSLACCARLIRAHEATRGFLYTHVVAARPDTAFLVPLAWDPLPGNGVRILNYEHGPAEHGGLNDRFAYGDAASMLKDYMSQCAAPFHPLVALRAHPLSDARTAGLTSNCSLHPAVCK